MRTDLCDTFGIDVPIFAFAHSRGVVAAASRNGAFGVLGAVGLDANGLERALSWIDGHVDGAPYGVDFLLPARSADTGTRDGAALIHELEAQIPDGHRRFVRAVLTEHGITPRPIDAPERSGSKVQTSAANVYPMLDVALSHPGVRLIVNALGPPPLDVLERAHDEGRQVAALVGARRHAERNLEVGVDIIVAQGTEAGGHSGEIATMVLTPEVVEAVRPKPVLAAGGIASGAQLAAAFALGAKGAWIGSAWLTTTEAEADGRPGAVDRLLAARSVDTVRSRAVTGKPVRQLRSAWSDAWSRPDAPIPLDMPLQQLLVADALPDDGIDLQSLGITGPLVGQVVGQLNERRSTAEVLQQLIAGFDVAVADLVRLTERGPTT